MCGRYTLEAGAAEFAARFGLPLEQLPGWSGPRYNIAPSQPNPVIRNDGGLRVELMEWGLVPAWSKEPRTRYSTINARLETVAAKPAYRGPLHRQRCLVPATGYYEWQTAPGLGGAAAKTPYYVHLQQGDSARALFAFAGLYEVWRGPDGAERTTYTILTTQAAAALAPLHPRMPVILPRAAEAAWLDAGLADPVGFLTGLAPAADGTLVAYAVSPAVNSVAHDGPALIAPAAGRPAGFALA